MSFYAVTYHYIDAPEQIAAIRPAHREWLKLQLDTGKLKASGPMVDFAGALLIFELGDLASLAALLDNDPFDIAGFIDERVIHEWNPAFGPWSD